MCFVGLSDVEELWIGLHDTAMQMNFEWTDRTPVIFTLWHPFEPNNFLNTKEDCVIMWGPVSVNMKVKALPGILQSTLTGESLETCLKIISFKELHDINNYTQC